MLAMLDAEHDLPLCRAVARKLVGDHDTGRPHLPLQQFAQQPLGRLLVASLLPRGFSDACLRASPRTCAWQASENP